MLVESPSNFVVLINNDGGKILGVITLHDLLRAESKRRRSGWELSSLATLPANQRSLTPDGQPVIVEIAVTEVSSAGMRTQDSEKRLNKA